MRRADRLFRIIQLLRGRGRARTARWLAEQLEVSERTVYRDVRDLIASGTPIEGEAGVGYTLRHYDLPPLMFDAEEIEALALGARHKLRLRYRKEDGAESDRIVRPLGAFFWGWNWTLTAWCELRSDFRNFRLDRIVTVDPTHEQFDDESGRSLRDYLRTIGPHGEDLLRD